MSDTTTPKKTAKKAVTANGEKPANEETVFGETGNSGIASSAIDLDFNFEKETEGEIFGGSYPRLELLPNQTTTPLCYSKDTEIPLDGDPDPETGAPTTKMQVVHIAETPSGDYVSCPISAIFMKHFKEAKIAKGDKFRIKRYPNAVKKRGKGSGREMQVYAIAVVERAETES